LQLQLVMRMGHKFTFLNNTPLFRREAEADNSLHFIKLLFAIL
jgi:hypothetical protein